jgi:hypothetical protein
MVSSFVTLILLFSMVVLTEGRRREYEFGRPVRIRRSLAHDSTRIIVNLPTSGNEDNHIQRYVSALFKEDVYRYLAMSGSFSHSYSVVKNNNVPSQVSVDTTSSPLVPINASTADHADDATLLEMSSLATNESPVTVNESSQAVGARIGIGAAVLLVIIAVFIAVALVCRRYRKNNTSVEGDVE